MMETTTKSFVEHFINWAFPVMEKKRDEEAAETEKAAMTHEQIGEMLTKKISGFERTQNAVDPNEPGSAWKVNGDMHKEVGQALRMMGYRQRGKSWARKPYQVDIGVSDGVTYVYITDDN